MRPYITRNWLGQWFIVFDNSVTAEKWLWLFYGLFGKRLCCFNGFWNAYQLTGVKRELSDD